MLEARTWAKKLARRTVRDRSHSGGSDMTPSPFSSCVKAEVSGHHCGGLKISQSQHGALASLWVGWKNPTASGTLCFQICTDHQPGQDLWVALFHGGQSGAKPCGVGLKGH